MGADSVDERLAPLLDVGLLVEAQQKIVERLQSTFEANLIRCNAGFFRGDGHDFAYQVIRQHMHVKLFADSFGSLASQIIHLQNIFDAS